MRLPSKVPHLLERRVPLTDRQKLVLVIALIRNPAVFEAAKPSVTPAHFSGTEAAYAAIWSVVAAYYDQHRMLPNEEELLASLEEYVHENPDALSDEDMTAADEFLQLAFAFDLEVFRNEEYTEYLKRFLEDRLAETLRETMHVSSYTPTDMVAFASKLLQQADEIRSVASGGVDAPFQQNWLTASPRHKQTPVGIKFFDEILNGGYVPGEVIGILGPSGSCKTTLGLQISIHGARASLDAYERESRTDPAAQLGFWYYFFYADACFEEMQQRAAMCAGKIRRSSFDQRDVAPFSSSEATLKDYERRMFAKVIRDGGRIRPEIVRLREAEALLNRNWRVVDMTGADPAHPSRGAGGWDEVSMIIKQDLAVKLRAGLPARVDGVTIDYAGAAVERMCDARGLSRDREFRHLLKGWGLYGRMRIAQQFHCPLFLLHQLKADSASYSPSRVPKMCDAAEGKAFGENQDFVLTVGVPNKENLAIFHSAKHRRTGSKATGIIRILGDIGQVVGVSDYKLDTSMNQIVSLRELEQVDHVSSRPGRAASQRETRSVHDDL